MTQTHGQPIRGVIFDLDGTLTVPALDFDAIRADIGAGDGPILEYLQGLPEQERRRAYEILRRHEAAAAERSQTGPGAKELLRFLRTAGIRTVVVTRNSRASVETFSRKHEIEFDAVVTREDAPPKPSPVPLRMAAQQMGLRQDEVIFVGDFEIDRLTGEAAGVQTYIVQNHPGPRGNGAPAMRVDNLSDVIRIIKEANGLPERDAP